MVKTVENVRLNRAKTTMEKGCDSCYFNESNLPCQAPPDFPLRCLGTEDGEFYVYIKMSSEVKEQQYGSHFQKEE